MHRTDLSIGSIGGSTANMDCKWWQHCQHGLQVDKDPNVCKHMGAVGHATLHATGPVKRGGVGKWAAEVRSCTLDVRHTERQPHRVLPGPLQDALVRCEPRLVVLHLLCVHLLAGAHVTLPEPSQLHVDLHRPARHTVLS